VLKAANSFCVHTNLINTGMVEYNLLGLSGKSTTVPSRMGVPTINRALVHQGGLNLQAIMPPHQLTHIPHPSPAERPMHIRS